MSGTPKKLIMFDFDGVLIDTLDLCYKINGEANPELTLEQYKNIFNGNIYKAFDAGEFGKPHPDYHGRYEEKTRELVVPDEIKKFILALSEVFDLAVVSSTPSPLIKAILERGGIGLTVKDIFGTDVHFSKVVKIGMLLEKYKCDPTKTVFVTDTVGDIKEARECGVSSIAVTWGFHERERLEKAEPVAIVDSVPELAEALTKFFSPKNSTI